MFAKTWRVDYHPWEAYVSLGLAVWVIYVADRLLDASIHGDAVGKLEPRHEFHQKHRRAFIAGICVASIYTLYLVIRYMQSPIYHYLLIGCVLVAGFFGLSLLSAQEADEVPHTKNILAGTTFAFGTAMMAHHYLPAFGIYEMLTSREFICFTILCILNISAIDLWEHAHRSPDVEEKASDELALTLPLVVLAAAALIFALRDTGMATRPFFYSILTGAALLQILNRCRSRFSMDALRVLADVAIFLPFFVFIVSNQT